MTYDPIRSITEIVTALTGVGSLGFLVFTWIMLRRAAIKVDEMHQQTADLVVHTNSLTTLLVEKTDIAARAEGVKEGIASVTAATIDTQAAALAREAASAAARILAVAADQAALVLSQAAADRTVK